MSWLPVIVAVITAVATVVVAIVSHRKTRGEKELVSVKAAHELIRAQITVNEGVLAQYERLVSERDSYRSRVLSLERFLECDASDESRRLFRERERLSNPLSTPSEGCA